MLWSLLCLYVTNSYQIIVSGVVRLGHMSKECLDKVGTQKVEDEASREFGAWNRVDSPVKSYAYNGGRKDQQFRRKSEWNTRYASTNSTKWHRGVENKVVGQVDEGCNSRNISGRVAVMANNDKDGVAESGPCDCSDVLIRDVSKSEELS